MYSFTSSPFLNLFVCFHFKIYIEIMPGLCDHRGYESAVFTMICRGILDPLPMSPECLQQTEVFKMVKSSLQLHSPRLSGGIHVPSIPPKEEACQACGTEHRGNSRSPRPYQCRSSAPGFHPGSHLCTCSFSTTLLPVNQIKTLSEHVSHSYWSKWIFLTPFLISGVLYVPRFEIK